MIKQMMAKMCLGSDASDVKLKAVSDIYKFINHRKKVLVKAMGENWEEFNPLVQGECDLAWDYWEQREMELEIIVDELSRQILH